MTNTYDTRAFPLGSKDPRVLYNNASNFDDAVNAFVRTWVDRFGRDRKTWYGFEQDFNDFLINSGFESTHLTYVVGTPLTVNRSTQLIDYNGSVYRVKMPASFPVNLTGVWATDSTLLVDVGDASIRQFYASLLPGAGASAVGNAVVSCSDIPELLSYAPARTGQSFVTQSYHSGWAASTFGAAGGSRYVWNAAIPHSAHTGGDVISGTAVWNGSDATFAAFLDGSSDTNPSGNGCFELVFDGPLWGEQFGMLGDDTFDNTTPFQNFVDECCRKNINCELGNGRFFQSGKVTVDGKLIPWSSFYLHGQHRGDAISATRNAGTVIVTQGAGNALEIIHGQYQNESSGVCGIAFHDRSGITTGINFALKVVQHTQANDVPGSPTAYRYISFLKYDDLSMNGYGVDLWFQGRNTSFVYNYIGPLTVHRLHGYNSGVGIYLCNATLNAVTFNDGILHECLQGGIILAFDGDVGGGNGFGAILQGTFNAFKFEACRGMFRTLNVPVYESPGGRLMFNQLVLNDVRHEFCGRDGISGGTSLGEPWALGINTIVEVKGMPDNAIAYGEQLFPAGNTGCRIHSDMPIRINPNGAELMTPKTINAPEFKGTIAPSATAIIPVTSSTGEGFSVVGDLVLENGSAGAITIYSEGNTSGTGVKRRRVVGSAVSGIVVSAVDGDPLDVLRLAITNNLTGAIMWRLRVTNDSGALLLQDSTF